MCKDSLVGGAAWRIKITRRYILIAAVIAAACLFMPTMARAGSVSSLQQYDASYLNAMQNCVDYTSTHEMWYTWKVVPGTCQRTPYGTDDICTMGFKVWRSDVGTVFTDPTYNNGGWEYGCPQGWSPPTKQSGVPKTNCNCVGDPINVATGNSFLRQEDVDFGEMGFVRYYNSTALVRPSLMGKKWRYSFSQELVVKLSMNQIIAVRDDGKEVIFNRVNTIWNPDSDIDYRLEESDDAQGNVTGYVLHMPGGGLYEEYSPDGLLQSIHGRSRTLYTLEYENLSTTYPLMAAMSVTDAHGRKLQFTYDSTTHRLTKITLPSGKTVQFSYSTNSSGDSLLASVTYPDSSVRHYVYDEAAYSASSEDGLLTGITDEAASRFETFSYDDAGRAISNEQAGGVAKFSVQYASDGSGVSITYPLGRIVSGTYAVHGGVYSLGAMGGACGSACNQNFKALTWDANGYPASRTDFKNAVTNTSYDANGLLGSEVEVSGSSIQRAVDTAWDTSLRVPLNRTVTDASGTVVSHIAWVYNARGQVLAKCEIDDAQASGYSCMVTGTPPAGVRRWTYAYCDAVDTSQCPLLGLTLSITGPRTDLTQTTTYSYYMDTAATGCTTPGGACHQPGDLHAVTDALGHVTTIDSYDADGRVTRETDANGVHTDMTYTPRGWLASRSVGGAITSYTYTPYGKLASTTDPDGVTISFSYDDAHRLTDVTDAKGNHIHYTLDAAGNKTKTQVFRNSN